MDGARYAFSTPDGVTCVLDKVERIRMQWTNPAAPGGANLVSGVARATRVRQHRGAAVRSGGPGQAAASADADRLPQHQLRHRYGRATVWSTARPSTASCSARRGSFTRSAFFSPR